VPSKSWTVVASEPSVAQLRESVADFAYENGMREPRLSDVRLAVSEAVTNAIVHAFRGFSESGTVTVAVAVHGHDWLEVRVTDNGSGMSYRDDSPGLGLGLPLIRHLSDQFNHQHPPDGAGTELWMRFAITGAEGPEGDPPGFTGTRDTAS
jgi:anti-sigma regulatory factor (Ser/Thr protein kinase)